MANRRKFTSEFKKQVVLEALKERETLSELAQKYDVHPQQITTWKAHFWHMPNLYSKKKGVLQRNKTLIKSGMHYFALSGKQFLL